MDQGLNGGGDQQGLVDGTSGVATGARGVADGTTSLADGAQQLADGLVGTDDQPGLVQGAEGVQQYADGLATAFDGDGTADNPGLVDGADSLAKGARSSADGATQLQDGITSLDSGLHDYADGSTQLADGARSSADGATQLADGSTQLADGTRQSADGAGQLSGGPTELADGTRSSADGAGQLADGTTQLADGADQLGTGADQLADGSSQLADGTGDLADGTDQLADGSSQLADGSSQLADGLQDGADQVPSYSEAERDRMSAQGAKPVTTDVARWNEANGADTAIFPFVVALALWLGAFATFLLLPALQKRLLQRALPMWAVALRSLAPAIALGVAQAVAVLAVLTAIGISPVSPLAVGLVALGAAVMFAALHQGLLTLFGDRMGRIVSILLLVLQVVALVGILPLQTAPPLLQAISGGMPMTIVAQGLVHAALGGSLVSTTGTLGLILVVTAASFVVTLLASRGARRADARHPREVVGAEPAAA